MSGDCQALDSSPLKYSGDESVARSLQAVPLLVGTAIEGNDQGSPTLHSAGLPGNTNTDFNGWDLRAPNAAAQYASHLVRNRKTFLLLATAGPFKSHTVIVLMQQF